MAVIALILALVSGPVLGQLPVRRGGIAFPGLQPVTLSLGGVRSLGFGDPASLATNPSAISRRLGRNLYSVSYGPVIADASFEDGSGTHENSRVDLLGSSSLGIDLDVTETITVGLCASSTAQLPFSRVHYVPGYSSAGADVMEVKGSFGELDVGGAWAANDWLVAGGALGIRLFSQGYDVDYDDSTGTLKSVEYEWQEACFNCGVSIPLDGLAFGLCWSSPGDLTDAVIAGGGMADLSGVLSAGGELEVRDSHEGDILTGRIFCTVRLSGRLAFRAGLFSTGSSSEISREGTGFSGGAGYSAGSIAVNAAFSWSPIRGWRDGYGYDELESYDGESLLISLGIFYRGSNEPISNQ